MRSNCCAIAVILANLVQKFRTTGSILDKKRTCVKRVLTEEMLDEIGHRLERKSYDIIPPCISAGRDITVFSDMSCFKFLIYVKLIDNDRLFEEYRLLRVQFKLCHGSLYAVMWLADEPREFNLPKLPQRRITRVPEKLPSKYGVHSEEYVPIRTSESPSFTTIQNNRERLDADTSAVSNSLERTRCKTSIRERICNTTDPHYDNLRTNEHWFVAQALMSVVGL
ncbi:hypothetical protein ANN_04172 [Periplaneta americana]|uniref:Uncharacterized protein n=1 Tax=Periplaneta americana TaxID=6978 RepID=A0ABQ8T7V1_PERAM|nr:hypothetical protein ANN_04172 [Periplaneta americana]